MISHVVDWKVAQSRDSFPALLFHGLALGVLLPDFLLEGIDQDRWQLEGYDQLSIGVRHGSGDCVADLGFCWSDLSWLGMIMLFISHRMC